MEQTLEPARGYLELGAVLEQGTLNDPEMGLCAIHTAERPLAVNSRW